MKNTRISFIDQAKGMGILLIVLGHISYIYGGVSNFATYFKISIFYVISGYLFSIQNKKIDIKKKTLSIMVPYFFWSIVYLVIEVLNASVRGFDNSRLGLYIVEIISGRGVSTLWFLPSLLIAVIAHKYALILKVPYRAIMLVTIPMLAIIASRTELIANPVEEVGVELFIYCISVVLLKGLVAYWFLELSYLVLDRLMKTRMPVFTPFLLIVGGVRRNCFFATFFN